MKQWHEYSNREQRKEAFLKAGFKFPEDTFITNERGAPQSWRGYCTSRSGPFYCTRKPGHVCNVHVSATGRHAIHDVWIEQKKSETCEP